MQSGVENSKKNTAKDVAECGVLIALALIFSYVEAIIPFSVGIPGVKLGLANLVVLGCLYLLSPAKVLGILIARVILSGFLFGNVSTIIYSLAGGILSFAVMLLLKKLNYFSTVGVSILGGVSHNIGQIIVAILVVENISLITYLPILLIAGSIAGALVGIVSKQMNPLLKKALT